MFIRKWSVWKVTVREFILNIHKQYYQIKEADKTKKHDSII